MSNLVSRAAIMAPPPGAAPADGTPPLSLATLPKIVAMGGIMWLGGKLAGQVWDYASAWLDSKPEAKVNSRKKRSSAVAVEEPDEDEPEEDDEDDLEEPDNEEDSAQDDESDDLPDEEDGAEEDE